MNRNRWIPAAAVAAVVAVVTAVAGVSLLTREGPAAGPPVLRLAAAQGVSPAYDSLASSVAGARGSFRLVGTLPNGPSQAHVWNLPPVVATSAQVRALASALGETAVPKRVDGVWKAGDLVVTDKPGNPWTWGSVCAPDTPVSSDGSTTGNLSAPVCGGSTGASGTVSSGTVAPGGVTGSSGTGSSGTASRGTITPVPPVTVSPATVGPCPSPLGTQPIACGEPIPLPRPLPPEKVLVTEAQALAATAGIRAALGLGSAPTRVEGLTVVVDPVVGGLPTNGMATQFQLSSQAKLVSATGWVASGRQGALYPLRTARKAFDSMPVLALGAPCTAAGCPEGPAITGARLGLSRTDLVDGAAALAPAWLFSVKGSPVPLVAIAVADRYLGGPDPIQPPSRTKPGGTDPGATEPDPGNPVTPPPPNNGKGTVPTSREPFAFDGAYADADPKVLVVRYGDSGTCPSQAVRHDVVEEPGRVVVTLTRAPMPTDQACTSDYQVKLVRITLTAPLGSREVVDGSRKTPVPISTGTPPFG